MFRPRFSALILVFMVTATLGFSQAFVLPRDHDKLMSRVQQYWDALKASKRNSAMQLVLSEDRDVFLDQSSTTVIKDVQITGLDYTGDRNKALVRGTVRLFPVGAVDSFDNSIEDLWVWRNNNWYLHVPSSAETAAEKNKIEDAEVQKYIKEFEASLALESDVFDAGSLVRGPIQTLKIPLKYTGKWDLNVETLPPATFVYTRKDNMAAPLQSFPLYVDTNKASDEFSVSLVLRFWAGVAAVEKPLTVTGKVFSPISFRGPSETMVPGKPVQVFVQNNTDEAAEVLYFTTNDDFTILSFPQTISPHQEAEVVLEALAGRKPKSLGLLLRKPVSGLDQFSFKLSPAP